MLVRYGVARKRVDRAQDNIPGFEAQSKKDFYAATGLAAMIAAKLVTKPEAQALARVWYRDFTRKSYGGKNGAEGQKAKARFVGDFSKQITAQKKIKKTKLPIGRNFRHLFSCPSVNT